jgi:hypothetical protein
MIEGKKAIYLAVLNQGEIAVELAQCLDSILATSEYPIFIDYACEKPISYNRNQIVKRFLERPQYDYLIMIDSDIVPPPNYLNLVDFQKDIISGVCFVYAKNKVFPLVLKKNHSPITGNKYKSYDGIDPKKWTGLIEVASIGTGAIVLSRKVLEAIPYPFRNEYDKTGEKLIGLDLNFCRRAKKLGFKVFCHTDYICDHHTRFNLRSLYYTMWQAYQDINKLKDENQRITRQSNRRKIAKTSKTRVETICDNDRKEQGDGIICPSEGKDVPTSGNSIPEVPVTG